MLLSLAIGPFLSVLLDILDCRLADVWLRDERLLLQLLVVSFHLALSEHVLDEFYVLGSLLFFLLETPHLFKQNFLGCLYLFDSKSTIQLISP